MADETDIIDPINGGAGGNPDDKGGEGAQANVKIGENEYTPEQLTEALKKATDYDNLLPDYTKKAQALAALSGAKPQEGQEDKDLPSFLKEGWKPKDFKELGQAMKEAAEFGAKRAEEALKAKDAQAVEAKNQVDTFVADVKKTDKDFDEQDFFQYIIRHGFAERTKNADDLKSLYSMYSEANSDGKLAERRALANKIKRATDSVSKPGSTGASLPYDANAIRTKGGNILDAAKEALEKFK